MMKPRQRTAATALVASSAIFTGGTLLSLFFGATSGYDPQIFWVLRVPRTLSAIAVGGGLAVAGTLVQAGLGNPLADPYTLGVASAAALGAVLATLAASAFHLPFQSGDAGAFFGTTAIAFFFAIGSLAVLTAWLRKSFHSATEVLLVGVIASFFFTALATLVMALADPSSWPSAVSWLMGTLGHLTLAESVAALLLIISVSAVGWLHWKPLDLISVDETSAEAVGLPIASFRKRIFILVALITAICVATAGIIGFVGLIGPHILRRLGVRGHRMLVPAAFIFGAALLLCSDVLARVVVRPSEIPVGIVMAIVGAPFFLALVRRGART